MYYTHMKFHIINLNFLKFILYFLLKTLVNFFDIFIDKFY